MTTEEAYNLKYEGKLSEEEFCQWENSRLKHADKSWSFKCYCKQKHEWKIKFTTK
ncbi:MAG: hypothetical protein AAB456_00115 [Patescibacteria group bacterium]